MTLSEKIESTLKHTHDFDSFVSGLLSDVLQWPIAHGVKELEEIGFTWTAEELKTLDLDNHVIEGQIWQIQPLPFEKQPWGIFLLEFKSPTIFIKGRGLTGLLRKVLRGLVPTRRRSASLPSWQADNILFLCTHNWEHYRFAHFRSTDEGKRVRLSTFGWGPGTSNRTACEFNLPELLWPTDDSDREGWVKQWSKAFDKEELTKQFYKTFAELYEQVREEISRSPSHHVRAQEHAQLLLDRLLFLSFLQKKRWLNNEPNYLYSRFEECFLKDPDGYSYYPDVLHPLFEALSNRGQRSKTVGSVPFLNGGLFDLEIGNQVAALTQMRLKVKNSTFKKIFDNLLNKYNFTVMEDTPLNREVAVDPEMLGKVFETVVLVSDTGGDSRAPDLRKATGSYYTPRIVVHFICREVLLKYLSNRLGRGIWETRIKELFEIDASDGLDKNELASLRQIMKPEEAARLRNAVERLKCCDPAVGSGAFAVGLLQELLNLGLLCEACERGKDPRLEKGTNYFYEKKVQIIENSIYGVDIQAKAVDICKLRLWLSLVVDYELGVDPADCTIERFDEAVASIPPLPNLAYKIRQGDALIDQIHGAPFLLERVLPTPEIKTLFEKLREEHKKFFREEDPIKKRAIRKRALDLRVEYSKMLLEAEKTTNLTLVQETIFGGSAKHAQALRWREAEEAKVNKALDELKRIEMDLAVFKSKGRLSQDDEDRLEYLEKGDERSLTFSWLLDFPEVFNRIEPAPTTIDGRLNLTGGSGQQSLADTTVVDDGFDIIVGNPPFVTARNEEKRELYRERWQPYCYKKYHLLVPFFPRSFGIMAEGAELGFIVSNAFAKREFGKPLVEHFFPKVDVNKVVDCSGLLFPGHGTPTCIVFGRNRNPADSSRIRVAAILPGGGDLRTPPEDSPLWASLEAHHDDAGYSDNRVIVADRSRSEMSKWPWNFDAGAEPTKLAVEKVANKSLHSLIAEDIGFMFVIGRNDIFVHMPDAVRRIGFSKRHLRPLIVGDEVRDWCAEGITYAFFPYDPVSMQLIDLSHTSPEGKWFAAFDKELAHRPTFDGTFASSGRKAYEYHQLPIERAKRNSRIIFPDVATHQHFTYSIQKRAFNQHALTFRPSNDSPMSFHLIIGLLNSSVPLFWLKQVCYNKGAGEAEEKDRFEYSGGKVEQLPVPSMVAQALEGKADRLTSRLTLLSEECWKRGQRLSSLAMKKLFEKKGEGYDSWNRSLPGFMEPHPLLAEPFADISSLRDAYERAISERELLRTKMIALQEEMDWLVYEAYGLIDKAARCTMQTDEIPEHLPLGHRPFELWAAGDEEFANACDLIPNEWTAERRALWNRRLEAIRDNEHIRRIEQPVYKRRWYQPDSYEKQLEKTFKWWLLEKAEWWLENKKNGGPVTLETWAEELWKDERVQAATAVVQGHHVNLAAFIKRFRAIVNSETVPEGIPFAQSWDDLKAKGLNIPAKVKNIRGKLNVPRERFRLRGKNEYLWAGLDWRKCVDQSPEE